MTLRGWPSLLLACAGTAAFFVGVAWVARFVPWWLAPFVAAAAALAGALVVVVVAALRWNDAQLFQAAAEEQINREQAAEIKRLNATGGADVRYAQAQDALIAALRQENADLRTSVERLEAENVALKRRFGTRSEDRP